MTRRSQETCVVTPAIPMSVGRPATIPRVKKTSACGSIARLFLVSRVRHPPHRFRQIPQGLNAGTLPVQLTGQLSSSDGGASTGMAASMTAGTLNRPSGMRDDCPRTVPDGLDG